MSPIIILAMIIIGGISAPPIIDATVGNNIQPDNPLYTIERIGEQIRLLMAQHGIGNYTNLLESISDERLNELRYCINHNETNKIDMLINDYNNTVKLLIKNIIAMNNTHALYMLMNKLKEQQHELEQMINNTTYIMIKYRIEQIRHHIDKEIHIITNNENTTLY